MSSLNECITNLYQTIIGEVPSDDEALIKMHTRYLGTLGDLSFPIPRKNWCRPLKEPGNGQPGTIFSYKMNQGDDVDGALQTITETLSDFNAKIRTYKVIKTSAHLFLERPLLFSCGIQEVLAAGDMYGKWLLFPKSIQLATTNSDSIGDVDDVDLTSLRLHVLRSTIENFLKLTANVDSPYILYVNVSKNVKAGEPAPNVLCGPVLNEKGVKDTTHKASDIFKKRILDIRMYAEHRYRVNIKSHYAEWCQTFNRLGRGSVILELLSSKPQKSAKIAFHDLSGPNKGPSFIFYNSARLSGVLREFESKVNDNIYPCLPTLDNIDFSLLNQPEEWELMYVYILQYPYVIKSCVRSIEKGIVNPQHLITFLFNLSSLYSAYYRRVRILRHPRDHMFANIYPRIYLLKALQFIFHNSLKILNIEPVQEM